MRRNKEKAWAGIEAMARAKRDRRLQLAALPFEEKMRILLQLQKAARGIRRIDSTR